MKARHAAVVLLLVSGCGNLADDPPPNGCDLLPDDTAALLGTRDWDVTSTELTRGPNQYGLVASCTLSSQEEKDRTVRLTVRPLTAQQVEARRRQLTPTTPLLCSGGRRFVKDGGIGVSCPEDIGGATVTRLTSVWGDLEVGTQVLRPGAAQERDPFRLYGLARSATERYRRWHG